MNMQATYQFSQDWFSPNIPAWNILMDSIQPRRFLEIGSFEGRSTVYLIEKCADVQPIEIHCIDPWIAQGGYTQFAFNEVEARFDNNVALAIAKAKHPVRFVKHKANSSGVLARLIAEGKNGYFDFVYVDGSHEAPDVLVDAALGFQLLRIGGLMIFDDYLWHAEEAGKQDVLNMPKIAVDAFLNIFQRKMRMYHRLPLYQVYANKFSD